MMKLKLIKDGNAFYEVDEECIERKRQEEREKKSLCEEKKENPE